MKHLGDITKINGAEVEPVDIIVGGSPCQDLSVAGLRAGLAGARSGLFMEQIRIVKEMRENDRVKNGRTNATARPRYMVWENVPGAFSSNKGEDFRAVLEETAKIADENAVIPRPAKGKWTHAGCIVGDGWSIAWRLHDAQFWGVPQRRKRISLVADFGGDTAPEILFEREGVHGNTSESGKEGERVAGAAEGSIDETGKCLNGWDVQSKHIQPEHGIAESLYAGECRYGGGESYVMQNAAYTLKIRGGADTYIKSDGSIGTAGKGALIQTELSGTLGVSQDQTLIAFEPGAASRVGGHVYENDKAGTVRANAGDNQQAVVYGISSDGSNAMRSDNPHSGIYEAETTRTLDNNGGNPACNQGGMMVVQGADVYNGSLTGDVAATLTEACGGTNTSGAKVVCLEGNGSRPSHMGDGYVEGETMYTLNSTEHYAVCVENHPNDSRVKIRDDGMVQTLSGRMGTGGGNVPMVMESKAVESHAQDARYNVGDVNQPLSANMEHDPANGGLVMESINGNVAGTLDASYYKGCGERQGVEREVVCVGNGQLAQARLSDKVGALNCMHDQQAVMTYGLDRASFNQGQNAQYNFQIDEEKIGTQVAKGPGAVCQSVVRRLTPLECERLQGFPDGWTDIGDWIDSKGKKHKGEADAPRYKALGNSIALPFWQWMAERMVAQLDTDKPTMASLFDGIGGFPLVYSRCGCRPVWASEIEEFPIAVTKVRFPDDRMELQAKTAEEPV